MVQKVTAPALRLTLIYLFFGGLWILFSDRVLAWFVDEQALFATLQTVKGWLFVVVTGALFYGLATWALQEQHKLLQRDSLTGLLNRHMLEQETGTLIGLATRQEDMISVFALNIDGFKQINAGAGHNIADRLLCQIADELSQVFPATALIGRVGADEFIIVQREQATQEGLEERAFSLLEICRRQSVQGHLDSVSCCVGVALFPQDAVEPEKLLGAASVAVEEAKRAGPGHYRMFNQAFSERFENRMRLLQDLRFACDRQEFSVVYQPQYAVASGEVTGVEVLVRWLHPEHGPISPAEFIPLAEQHGLIHRITEFVFTRSMDELQAWHLLGVRVPRVSINVSAYEFDRDDYYTDIMALLQQYPNATRYIQFEITETGIMRRLERSVQMMQRLRRMGVRFSIDDFGTGYSSLSMLKTLPVHELKVDRSFIQDIPHDANDMMIARTVIGMARSLNMRLVAEGVETQAQHDFLRDNRCDEMQGFLKAPPMPVEALARRLDRRATG